MSLFHEAPFSNKHSSAFVLIQLLQLRQIKVTSRLCFKVKRKAKDLLPELLSTVPSLANCEEDKRIGEFVLKEQSPDWLSKVASPTFYDELPKVTKLQIDWLKLKSLQSEIQQES